MKIKPDHNLSRHLRERLEKFGHDVDTAFDEGLAGADLKKYRRRTAVVERTRIRIFR